MYCGYSDISCGVDQLYGFEDHEGGDIDALLDEVASAIYGLAAAHARYDSPRTPLRLPCVHIMFSDIETHHGDVFGQWLAQQNLGAIVEMRGKNPNSGNNIVTYVWKPDEGALRKLPVWEAARRRAVEHARKMRNGEW